MTDLTTTDQSTRRRPSPAAILAVVGFSVFVAADDLTVVSTMLRPIIGDLGLILPDGLDDAAWVVNAYLLPLSALLLLGGALGDHYGRRLLLLIGTSLFAVASLA